MHSIGVLPGEPPPDAAVTRIMQVRGADYYVYAPDPGLVELGAEVRPAPRRHCSIRTTRRGEPPRPWPAATPAP